jgi:hypothetical protein
MSIGRNSIGGVCRGELQFALKAADFTPLVPRLTLAKSPPFPSSLLCFLCVEVFASSAYALAICSYSRPEVAGNKTHSV